ncbi:sperm-associated antigen 16 protein [Polymixia lowei]
MAARTETDTPQQECIDGPFYLEKVSIPVEEEDDYEYEEVVPDEESGVVEEGGLNAEEETSAKKQMISHIPEAVDDFLRNFLVRMGLRRTVDTFQREWYSVVRKDLLTLGQGEFILDEQTRSQLLHSDLESILVERDRFRQAAFMARQTLVRIQKERDFHRLQYRRIAQEKNNLTDDIRRLRQHCASFEPVQNQLNDKYQTALRQKTLLELERDRAQGLELTMRNNNNTRSSSSRSATKPGSTPGGGKLKSKPDKSIKWSNNNTRFPICNRANPHLAQMKSVAGQGTKRSDAFSFSSSLKAHALPISCVAVHPRKFIVASASDDNLWRLWSMPVGEMIMTGKGHTDWLSGCSFHPDGGSLATTSGDTTVRLWDFSQGCCVLTLSGHGQATWGSSFHSSGDFLASCSMDNTAKVWDLHSQRCCYTLRGHSDSVNSVIFLPGSNALLTCSADKTVSVWDARTGLCVQTLYGHRHSCNHAVFNLMGATVASCDSHGVLKLWDVRKVSAVVTMDTGPHSGNQVAFSPSGEMLAVASEDGLVKLVELDTSKVSSLSGHSDAVQSVVFDHRGQHLISAGSDGLVAVWS